jgi:hypothetical protein
MDELIGLLIPVGSVENYKEMRRKLAGIFFWNVYLISFFLRETNPFSTAIKQVESLPPLKALLSQFEVLSVANIGGAVIAFVLSVFTYMIILHDKISDLARIRRDFDLEYILLPMIKRSGVYVSQQKFDKLSEDRDPVMREVFYKFASSRSENTIVDKHDIEQALTNWSWYWALIEAMPLSIILLIISVIGENSFSASCFAGMYAALLLLAWYFYGRCKRYIRPQVDAILADPRALSHIQGIFRAI